MELTRYQLAVIGGTMLVVLASGAAWLLLGNNDDVEEDDEPTVPDSPESFAAANGVTLEVECLARAIASEEGGQPRLYQEAVGCATVNFARAAHPHLSTADAVIALVLGTDHVFGRQGTGGRRVSSKRAAGWLQHRIATGIFAGHIPDPTGGATQFDSPAGQLALLAQNDPYTHKTPDDIAAERINAGYEQVDVEGIDAQHLRFWRKA